MITPLLNPCSPSSWVPATHMEGLDEVAGSWLQLGLSPIIVDIWEENEQMEDFCLSPSLSVTLPLK